MKIIILGAGQVGKTVAQALSHEDNDITVVDHQPQLLQKLETRLDIKTVTGHAAHPDVLERAGAEDADLILAVTNSDETNMIACQIAYSLFQTPKRLARVRSPSYLRHQELFTPSAVPIDFIISPELLVTSSIEHLIEHTEALQILDFAKGMARLVAVRAHSGGPLVDHELRSLAHQAPHIATKIVAIFRHDRAIIPDGKTVVEADDEVFFLAASRDIPDVLSAFGRPTRRTRRVIIAGGGNIGKRLAENIEKSYLVKLIEQDFERCRDLAKALDRTIVLHGDATDVSLLMEEDIKDTDIYCAVTNDDETNILSAMQAKRLGAGKTLSIITNPDYLDLSQGTDVDIAISPALFTISALLTHIRRADVVAVHSLRRGVAEAIELVAHGDRQTSKVVGRQAKKLPLPEGTSIGAIVRRDELIFINSEIVIESEDHLILFLVDKRQIAVVEKLFQVSSTYL
jgi:trk system potassium uptake protein TrkA